ncbi:MAG: squalene synthase HpnC [Deltaproteobacteria bacterium]|nr:squalene synthase HpnC [Deltaproteobacteria bacterium]
MTFGHYENFPVVSWWIPRHLKQHICNIYAFARGADDFADEPQYAGQRMDRLQEWRHWLHQCALEAMGQAVGPSTLAHPVFIALRETLRTRQLPVGCLNDLITAFMLDVTKTRYRSFGEVLHYCRHSANPVGRLMLHLFGYGNEQWMEASDNICTALQLANFWQDAAIDLRKNEGAGRIYIPQEDLERFHVTEAALREQVRSPALRQLMAFQVARTRALFAEGRLLCDRVPHPALRRQLRLTWLGGMRILEKITANQYDLFSRPALRWPDWGRLGWRMLRWQPSTGVRQMGPMRGRG